jgi:RNA polymerase sigma factor for flagellar operon FliA
MIAHTAPTQAPANLDADELAVRYLPIVTYLVRETMARVPSHVDQNALHSAGNVALVAASRAFDPERGVPFDRYATTRIRGALVDELRSVDWASRSVRRRSREMGDVRARLTSEGQSPDDAAVAKALGMSVEDVVRTDADVARAAVLPLEAGPDFSYADVLHAPGRGPEAALIHAERLEYLVDAIAVLPDRLAAVVQGYFLEERPMAELAEELGVTESRISQLRAEALVLLRGALNTALDPHLVEPHAKPDGVAARRRAAYTSAVAARHADRGTVRARSSARLEASIA